MSESARQISQRELRNDSGGILRAVEAGETFVVTRNGTPVAELRPLRRRAFVPSIELASLFRGDAVDADRLRADLDDLVDQQAPDGIPW